jgi:cysteine-rich repeat protein
MKLAHACLLALCFVTACGDDAGMSRGNVREDGGTTGDGDGDVDEGIVSLIDGGFDAGLIVSSCEGVGDGAGCGSMGGLVCIDEECVTSTCGDGFVNLAAESCEDGNREAGDGCEPDCSFTCEDDTACSDVNPCDGTARCDEREHVCVAGEPLGEAQACSTAAVPEGECRNMLCVPMGCGDEMVEGDEECDDGNADSGDGCEPTCVFTCETDAECFDGNVCTGVESCNVEEHTCVPGEAIVCEPANECFVAECHPEAGCTSELIDGDGDNHAPDTLACGTDCDDQRADVNPDQVELCDDVDQNCDGESQPDETPTWYVDCDVDGYAAIDAPSDKQCEEPAPTECGGRWTTRVPNRDDRSTFDCNDANPDARPMQESYFAEEAKGSGYDYNCDTREEQRWTNAGYSPDDPCLSILGTCSSAQGWTTKEPPACGGSADFTYCSNAGGVGCGMRVCPCGRVTAERAQECR